MVDAVRAALRALGWRGTSSGAPGLECHSIASLAEELIRAAAARIAARRGDLLDLADAVCPLVEAGQPVPWSAKLTPDAAQALVLYDWPDNLRMVRGCLTRAAALAKDDRVGLEHLPQEVTTALNRVTHTPRSDVAEKKRPTASRLRAALGKFRGNVDTLARDFGVHRRQVYRWLDYAGIDQAELRAARQEPEEPDIDAPGKG